MRVNRFLAGLVGGLAVAGFVVDLLAGVLGWPAAGLGMSLGGLVLVLFGCAWVWFSPALNGIAYQPAEPKEDQLVTEVVAFFDAVNDQRAFPEVRPKRVLQQPGEPALAVCHAQLGEVIKTGGSSYAGTRVMVGKVPIYLGASAPRRSEEIQLSEAGELVVTPARLIFVSPASSFELPLGHINGVEYGRDYIKLAAKGKGKPTLFLVPNGLLWGLLVRNLVAWRPDGRRLPDGVSLSGEA